LHEGGSVASSIKDSCSTQQANSSNCQGTPLPPLPKLRRQHVDRLLLIIILLLLCSPPVQPSAAWAWPRTACRPKAQPAAAAAAAAPCSKPKTTTAATTGSAAATTALEAQPTPSPSKAQPPMPRLLATPLLVRIARLGGQVGCADARSAAGLLLLGCLALPCRLRRLVAIGGVRVLHKVARRHKPDRLGVVRALALGAARALILVAAAAGKDAVDAVVRRLLPLLALAAVEVLAADPLAALVVVVDVEALVLLVLLHAAEGRCCCCCCCCSARLFVLLQWRACGSVRAPLHSLHAPLLAPRTCLACTGRSGSGSRTSTAHYDER